MTASTSFNLKAGMVFSGSAVGQGAVRNAHPQLPTHLELMTFEVDGFEVDGGYSLNWVK
jgi:hypothetical protein